MLASPSISTPYRTHLKLCSLVVTFIHSYVSPDAVRIWTSAFETESSQRTACVHVVRAMLGHGRHALLCHPYGRTLARPAYAGGWVNAGWRAPSPFPAKGSAWGLSTHLPCPRPGSLPRQAAAPPRLAGLLCRVLAPVNYRGRRQRRPASQACSAVSSPRFTTPAGGSAAPPRRLALPCPRPG